MLEDCYSAELKQRGLEAGTFALGAARDIARRGDIVRTAQALSHPQHRFYLSQTTEDCKTNFAQWLVAEGQAACDTLTSILDELEALLV